MNMPLTEELNYKLGNRISIQRKNHNVYVRMKMKPDFTIILFSLACLGFAAPLTLIAAIKVELSLFICVWLLSFSATIIFLTYTVLWNLFGVEVFHINQDKLIFERRLFSLKINKIVFEMKKIRQMRVTKKSEIVPSHNQSVDWFKISGGNIAFDYDEDVYTFGIDLSKMETREIIEIIHCFQ